MKAKKIIAMCGVVLGGLAVVAPTAGALTYTDESEIQFTFYPSMSMTLSDTDLTIQNLAPGNGAESNAITVTVNTSNAYGYDLYATVGSSTNASTELRRNGTDTTNKFTSLGTSTGSTTVGSGNWGYSTDAASVTTKTYSGLPVYSTASPQLINSTSDVAGTATGTCVATTSGNCAGGNTTNFRIKATAADGQVQGNYTNTINFRAVSKISTN